MAAKSNIRFPPKGDIPLLRRARTGRNVANGAKPTPLPRFGYWPEADGLLLGSRPQKQTIEVPTSNVRF